MGSSLAVDQRRSMRLHATIRAGRTSRGEVRACTDIKEVSFLHVDREIARLVGQQIVVRA